MLKKLLFGCGTTGVLLCGLGAHAAPNLLTDGSFESLNLVGGNFGNLLENYGPSGSVGSAWANSSNFILGIDTAYTEAGNLKFFAQEGTKSVDLTGAGNQGPVALSQTVSLAAGSYLLSFYLGDIKNTSPYSLASSVKVLINDVQQGSTFSNAAGTTSTNWVQFLVPFVSSGGATKVTFSTAGLTLDNYTGIDNVVLTAVPEVEAYGLALAGMGVVAFVKRRRRDGREETFRKVA